MNDVQVISVNPTKKTLGEKLFKEESFARISRTISSGRKIASPLKKFLNVMFGLNPGVNRLVSVKMLALRIVCGSIMIASVLLPMSPESILALDFGPHSIIMCALGLSLISGMLTRISSLAGIAWFGTLLFNSMMDGTPDVLAGAIAMIMTVFVIMGPGNYSVDQLARRAMFISARRSSRRNNRTDKHETFGYRAYTSVDRRVG